MDWIIESKKTIKETVLNNGKYLVANIVNCYRYNIDTEQFKLFSAHFNDILSISELEKLGLRVGDLENTFVYESQVITFIKHKKIFGILFEPNFLRDFRVYKIYYL